MKHALVLMGSCLALSACATTGGQTDPVSIPAATAQAGERLYVAQVATGFALVATGTLTVSAFKRNDTIAYSGIVVSRALVTQPTEAYAAALDASDRAHQSVVDLPIN